MLTPLMSEPGAPKAVPASMHGEECLSWALSEVTPTNSGGAVMQSEPREGNVQR